MENRHTVAQCLVEPGAGSSAAQRQIDQWRFSDQDHQDGGKLQLGLAKTGSGYVLKGFNDCNSTKAVNDLIKQY